MTEDKIARFKLAFRRDSGRCTAILKGCTGRAETLWNTTENHRGNEPLWELRCVCHNCRESLSFDLKRDMLQD